MAALYITFAVFLLLGVPIVFVLGLSILSYLIFTDQLSFLVMMPQRIFSGMDHFVLLAVPLFIFAGNVMTVGLLTGRLLDFANVFVGRFRGGASLTAIWGSFLFGGVSGSAAADAAALGSIMIPDMKRQGYDVDYSAALIGTSSIMAPLVPPSITMIIYGALSGTSIGRLFIAGIVPGFMLAVGLSCYAVWIARRRKYPHLGSAPWSKIWSIAREAGPVLLLPVIILGGIRGGVFTPTEAAAIASLYAVLVAGLYYRSLTFERLFVALRDTATMSATVFLLVGLANIASFVFAIERIPESVVQGLHAISGDRVVILLLINLGSGLIKSTIRGRLQGRQRLGNFAPACRIVWRCA